MKVQERWVRDGESRYLVWYLFCPGCEALHQVRDAATTSKQPVWRIIDRSDTFTCEPSILVQWTTTDDQVAHRCHSFVRNGQWQFLPDSTHQLAGQTVPLVDLPDWFVGE